MDLVVILCGYVVDYCLVMFFYVKCEYWGFDDFVKVEGIDEEKWVFF